MSRAAGPGLAKARAASIGCGESGIHVEPVKPRRRHRQGEAALSDAIREALALEPGLYLMRNSVALAKVRGGYAWTGLPRGSADLVGLLEVSETLGRGWRIGRFLALEVKREGGIPTAEDVVRIVRKLGPIAEAFWASNGARATLQAAHPAALAKLQEAERHVLEQEAWLDDVRRRGGFAAYVDSVEAGRAAVARARTGATS